MKVISLWRGFTRWLACALAQWYVDERVSQVASGSFRNGHREGWRSAQRELEGRRRCDEYFVRQGGQPCTWGPLPDWAETHPGLAPRGTEVQP